MKKVYLPEDVLQATHSRLDYVFANFPKVCLSFSGGKDSSVLLHLTLEAAKRAGRLPLDVLFIDLEAQYKSTIQHCTEMMGRPDVRPHWICLPLNLRNAVSTYQPFWTCWDPGEKKKWVRPLPECPGVISDGRTFPFFRPHMEFEQFTVEWAEWFSQGDPMACLVGIRSDESLNRWRTIASQSKVTHGDHQWTTKLEPDPKIFSKVYNAYPIYDWRTEDIWTAVGKNGWNYNRIYDIMYMAGMSIHQSRICQPYGDDQRRGLDLYHRCEPETWSKVVARVSGANFGKIYVKSALMGFRKMIKPPGHTWRSYTEFLLDSLPRYEKEWFNLKFEKFFAWWERHGGVPRDAVPDEADPKDEAAHKVPSWRRLARVVVTNDKLCKSLSFGQTVGQWDKYVALKDKYGI